MKRLICLTALAILTLPALAQSTRRAPLNLSFASDFQTVPVMSNTTGVGGSVFRTYVAILNPTSTAFEIEATLYDGAGNQHDAVIALAEHELKTFDNFLDTVFDATGGGAVTFRSSDSSERFVVSTEVWTDGGHYGTTIPALEFAGTDSRSFAPGVTVNAISRTNVGCFNQSSSRNVITVSVVDATGTMTLGTAFLDLSPNAWGQRGLSTVVSNGYVQFDPQDAAVCYAVVVDNSTHDGRFISAAEYRP
ncbi:MAG TPA: hypothetical protein VGQ76_19520 [Thermoanaerobaculia bacterium]|nr:hypothetical protein [Thermoanaerobaculia bacterium]